MDNNKIIGESIHNIDLFYNDLSAFLMKLSRDITYNYNFSDHSGNSVHLDNSTSINNPNSWAPYFVYKRFKEVKLDNYLAIYIGIKDYMNNYKPYDKFPVYFGYFKNAKKFNEIWWYCKDYVSNPLFNNDRKIIKQNELLELIPTSDESKGHFDSGKIHISELFSWEDDVSSKLKEVLEKLNIIVV